MRYEGRLSGEGAKFERLSLGVVGSGTKLKQNRSKQMKENRWEYDKIDAMELNEKQSKRNGRYKSKTKSSDRLLAVGSRNDALNGTLEGETNQHTPR